MGGEMKIDVTMNVPAKLIVVPEYGPERDATPADLEALGWSNRRDLYVRVAEFMRNVGLDPDGEHSELRCFVEDACSLAGFRLEDCSDWDENHDRYMELFEHFGAPDA